MFHYSNYELAVVITVPIVTILLLWTLAIFHKNKGKWKAYDITIVAILVGAVIRNVSVICYIAMQKISLFEIQKNFDCCAAFVWLFNSTHTFQASCLTTLAVIGLFSIKLYRKQQNMKQYLTTTHVIYHLFCLTTLCACVGVAAILAKEEELFDNRCHFMPYQLDLKFNAFIIVLHIFLATISFVAFLYICLIYWKLKRAGFDFLKKSTSDLSELSGPHSHDKGYYDTYTIQRTSGFGYDPQAQLNGYNTIWKSDVSNVSTTVSSTNSRKPLNKDYSGGGEKGGTGLETIHPVLIVCYLFYHLPIIILSIFPLWIAPWSTATVGLWLGLLQDIMIPVSLGILDTRFTQWVSKVYRCTDTRSVEGKLPHAGLDGKFRHFGSQPQSLEVGQMLPERLPGRCYQPTEHKFPITNGSLYTSIEGRVPVIHNYRRHNNENRGAKLDGNLLNLGIHSSNLKRVEQKQKTSSFRCTNCEKPHSNDLQYSPSNNSDFIRGSVYNLNVSSQSNLLKPYLRHVSLSQNSLRQIPLGSPKRENVLRQTKSYDSLNDLNKFKAVNIVDSDDEYFTDSVILERNFDTMSTQSSYSITTEANCDFEFYQNEKPDEDKERNRTSRTSSKSGSLSRHFKITRSNSKRSLENLQAYLSEENVFLHRSSSDSLRKPSSVEVSVEFVNDREGTFLDSPSSKSRQMKHFGAGGSVPDLKKIFISDYI
ncbi:PREDICTED: uncharacterized protein LOC108566398 [Nicrophorus vespilloides]|uniref:Uncharacterized protein LOC108566398 n=1 Tax=Nicrophorus vespilloides TaxID=110193 RepID=A0ABM1N4J8_NICVS|nr:PREDICTED: uncharacterized protein LOC108566398 [Nicrophorus vespilloides]XP_017781749.1 PREDICTED: uncharacterized protein LOC108566398 [Nicrophorus vespilloides]